MSLLFMVDFCSFMVVLCCLINNVVSVSKGSYF